ncbi:Flp family type IVb pilin [Vibrio breoganii]|uniref:Flp family type IVb pilin n=1 Tax=Vibrio breoganii TaxID=553239 RepID=UPI000C83DC26|nr:Flp family type IVb pilin [Vibrio breoganii]TKG29910.1 Flp family type IVb pilin [Vibrio breoganii]
MLSLLRKFLSDQNGVTAIEYAVMGMALAFGLAIIIGNTDSGFISTLVNVYSRIADAL